MTPIRQQLLRSQHSLAPTLTTMALLLTSCARFEVSRVAPKVDANGNEAWQGKGVRAYAPAPYLLVTKAKDESLATSIVMLPDRDRPMNITWRPGWFASVKPSFTLEGGWNLTGSGAEVGSDGGVLVSSLGGILSGVAGILSDSSGQPLGPGLYPLRFLEGRWTIE